MRLASLAFQAVSTTSRGALAASVAVLALGCSSHSDDSNSGRISDDGGPQAPAAARR